MFSTFCGYKEYQSTQHGRMESPLIEGVYFCGFCELWWDFEWIFSPMFLSKRLSRPWRMRLFHRRSKTKMTSAWNSKKEENCSETMIIFWKSYKIILSKSFSVVKWKADQLLCLACWVMTRMLDNFNVHSVFDDCFNYVTRFIWSVTRFFLRRRIV